VHRSCCLGCGGRARGHADAYKHVAKGRLEAVCDLNTERLNAFAEEWKIPRRYTDVHEMLEKEKPDLLHIVTQPQLRVELLTVASDHGVPAVLVEKPLCLDADDFNAIAALGRRTTTRICVNHQLRFHPKTLELLDVVRSGEIGELRLVDGSARPSRREGMAVRSQGANCKPAAGTPILSRRQAAASARPARAPTSSTWSSPTPATRAPGASSPR